MSVHFATYSEVLLHVDAMLDSPLDLFIFTAELETALCAEAAGVDSIIVDWERHGKHSRQNGHDTEINDHSVEAVSLLASHLSIPVTVRVNPYGEYTSTEVQAALDSGASTLMLPMAKSPRTVEAFVELVSGRAKTLIQIETQELADQCEALSSIGWDYAHVGLNDLKISRGSPWLWTPLVDGTIEHILRTLQDRAVGFGGATVIGGGSPIPFLNLFQEMARLNAGMALLRRSFFREVTGRNWTAEIQAMRAVWNALKQRTSSSVRRDHDALMEVLKRHNPVKRREPAPFLPFVPSNA